MLLPTDRIRAGFTITITDPGKDPDDEDVLVLFGSLVQTGFVHLAAYIANLAPSDQRARLLAGSMKTLGLPHVPFGVGTNCTRDADIEKYAKQFADISYMAGDDELEDGAALLRRAYKKAAPKSITLLLISGLTDAWNLLHEDPTTFRDKTRKVVLMGGVTVDREASSPSDAIVLVDGKMTADETAANNKDDLESARKFYREVQALGVKMVVLSRAAAYAVPFSSDLYTEMAKTGHPVGEKLNKMQGTLLDDLWRRANLHDDAPHRLGLPNRCNREWFLNTFTDEDPATSQASGKEPIWHLVTKLFLYDPLTAIASIDALRKYYFQPLIVTVPDATGKLVDHEIIGIKGSPEPKWNGVPLPGALRAFVWNHMMWSLFISVELNEIDANVVGR